MRRVPPGGGGMSAPSCALVERTAQADIILFSCSYFIRTTYCINTCRKELETMRRDEKHAKEPTGGLWDGAEIISGYSRAQAIADGVLVDLNQRPTPERPELDDLDAIARE